jgi:hypothetical protein
MVHVAQHADDSRGQRLVQDFDGAVLVKLVSLCYSALFDIAQGALPDLFHVFHKLWHEIPRGGHAAG